MHWTPDPASASPIRRLLIAKPALRIATGFAPASCCMAKIRWATRLPLPLRAGHDAAGAECHCRARDSGMGIASDMTVMDQPRAPAASPRLGSAMPTATRGSPATAPRSGSTGYGGVGRTGVDGLHYHRRHGLCEVCGRATRPCCGGRNCPRPRSPKERGTATYQLFTAYRPAGSPANTWLTGQAARRAGMAIKTSRWTGHDHRDRAAGEEECADAGHVSRYGRSDRRGRRRRDGARAADHRPARHFHRGK